MDVGQLLNGPLAPLGFGGVAGAIVGYTAKKVTKLAALVLGGVFILVQILAYEGFVEVHWDQVQKVAESTWQDAQGVTLAQRAWEILIANLPFGAGFATGFAIGFKIG